MGFRRSINNKYIHELRTRYRYPGSLHNKDNNGNKYSKYVGIIVGVMVICVMLL